MNNPITLEEERKVWTIHQPVNGQTYYFNRATKKSQYEMPECFKTTEEVLEHPQWKKYRTSQGKNFYYNASSRRSSWQLPNDVKEFRMQEEERRKKDRGAVRVEEQLSEDELTKRKFLALLRDKSVAVTTKWDSCIKLCDDDPRWQLLKTSDKKKAYLQYIAQLKKLDQTEKKAKTQIHRTHFLQMLRENKELNSSVKMHKVACDFLLDPRWRALEEQEREITFQMHLDELYQQEKDLQKEQKTRNLQMLRSTFQEDQVRYNAHWKDISSTYKDNPYFTNLHLYDRLSCFVEYILQAEKKQEQAAGKEKRLKERENRVQFRLLLKDKLRTGEVSYKSKWRSVLQNNAHEKAVLNMMDAQGTTAHQIFECFMEDIRQNHKLIKTELKHHFKSIAFKMNEHTTLAEFKDKAATLMLYSALKESVQDYFHAYFLHKIKAKHQNKQLSSKKSAKKERKLIFKVFKQFRELYKTKNLQGYMDKIQREMKEYGVTVTQEHIFKFYIAFTEAQEKKEHSRSNSSVESKKEEVRKEDQEEEEGEIKDDGQEKKKKPKRKRRSSSSDAD